MFGFGFSPTSAAVAAVAARPGGLPTLPAGRVYLTTTVAGITYYLTETIGGVVYYLTEAV